MPPAWGPQQGTVARGTNHSHSHLGCHLSSFTQWGDGFQHCVIFWVLCYSWGAGGDLGRDTGSQQEGSIGADGWLRKR